MGNSTHLHAHEVGRLNFLGDSQGRLIVDAAGVQHVPPQQRGRNLGAGLCGRNEPIEGFQGVE